MSTINIDGREKIREYFFPVKKTGCMWLVFLLAHIILAVITHGYSLIVTIPLHIWWSIYNKKKNKNKVKDLGVTGAMIDQLFSDELELLKKRAFERLGLDFSQSCFTPVEFVTPKYYGVRILRTPDDTTNENPLDLKIKIGENEVNFSQDEFIAIQKQEESSNSIRYTLVNYIILVPTDSYIASYSCLYTRVTGQILTEKSQEIFYSDVTQVSTERVAKEEILKIGTSNDEEVKSKSHSTFYLEVSSGSKITIDFADPEIQKMFGNTLLSDDYAESACQGLRKIVREKKV